MEMCRPGVTGAHVLQCAVLLVNELAGAVAPAHLPSVVEGHAMLPRYR